MSGTIARRLAALEAPYIARAVARLRDAQQHALDATPAMLSRLYPNLDRDYPTQADRERFVAELRAEWGTLENPISVAMTMTFDKDAMPETVAAAWRQAFPSSIPTLTILEDVTAILEDIAAEMRGAA